MKNIKKYYPLIVGLVLLISVAAYGTRAYFSDSTSEDVGIELTLGNIEIKSDSFEWKYKNFDEGFNNQIKVTNENNMNVPVGEKLSKKAKIKNVKPGDSFSKVFTFTNNSSLKSVFTILDSVDSGKTVPFEVSYQVYQIVNDKEIGPVNMVDITSQQGVYPLEGDESVKVEMTIKVDTSESVNDYNLKESLDKQNVLNLFDETISVKLEQAGK